MNSISNSEYTNPQLPSTCHGCYEIALEINDSGVTLNYGPSRKIFKMGPLQSIEISAVGKNRN